MTTAKMLLSEQKGCKINIGHNVSLSIVESCKLFSYNNLRLCKCVSYEHVNDRPAGLVPGGEA